MKWYPTFVQWNSAAVRQTLGLKAQDHLVALAEWVNAPEHELGTETALLLDDLRKLLKQQQYAWNEYEIMARFISPLLATIRFGGEAYNLFHQRELSLEYEGQSCKGTVDGLVALGVFDPEKPFFFIHEYKQSQGFDADPEGQLLIAMVAAQHLNNDGLPIYGCYIVGTYWRFVLLDGASNTPSARATTRPTPPNCASSGESFITPS